MNNIEVKKNDRKEIFGWMMYDWANSAFFTTVVGVLIGPYLLALATEAVGEDGVILDLVLLQCYAERAAGILYGHFSRRRWLFFLPVLGAIADYTHLKKRHDGDVLLRWECLRAALLFFVTGESYLVCSVLFIVANMSFAAANVFYNAFLIDITTEDQRDKVSSYGYGLGYHRRRCDARY